MLPSRESVGLARFALERGRRRACSCSNRVSRARTSGEEPDSSRALPLMMTIADVCLRQAWAPTKWTRPATDRGGQKKKKKKKPSAAGACWRRPTLIPERLHSLSYLAEVVPRGVLYVVYVVYVVLLTEGCCHLSCPSSVSRVFQSSFAVLGVALAS